MNNKLNSFEKKIKYFERKFYRNYETLEIMKKNETTLWICVYCKVKYLEKDLPRKNCPYCLNELIIPLKVYKSELK